MEPSRFSTRSTNVWGTSSQVPSTARFSGLRLRYGIGSLVKGFPFEISSYQGRVDDHRLEVIVFSQKQRIGWENEWM